MLPENGELSLKLERDLEEWFEERLLRVTKGIADRWGAIPAQALDRGKPLPGIDGVIAATPWVSRNSILGKPDLSILRFLHHP